MSNWESESPEQVSIHHVNANLDQVSTAASAGSAAGKAVIAVAAIGIVILAVAAVMIPLSLALTYSGPFSTTKKSTTATDAGTTVSTTTVTTQTTTTSTVTTSTVTTTTVTTTVTTATSFSACSSYTTISDSTRLTTSAGGSSCDQLVFSSGVTWIRFTGAGGTQLVTSAPSINLCNTQATGWYSGSLPSAGMNTNGSVCYVWSGSNCNWSNTVYVANCGSFYVFGLTAPPACNLRYCTA